LGEEFTAEAAEDAEKDEGYPQMTQMFADNTIETERLRLVPFLAEAYCALLTGDVTTFEEISGLRAGEGLGAFYSSPETLDEVSPAWMEQLRASRGADPWRHGFAVVERAGECVVGTLGFKGPPDDEGMVEIAYGIVPGRQGRGYATEAAKAGTGFAFGDERVRVVRAHTLPTNNASVRVMTKCGFEQLGEVIEPDDGLVLRWERKRND
jgi:RimJ/RimL family protein N-acetyltransferase